MEVGALLRKGGQGWVMAMEETMAFLGAVLGVIHPGTFAAGKQCINAIRDSDRVAKRENLEELLRYWASPFLSGSLISNRDSGLHWDTGGNYPAMDLLVSVGPYANGSFTVPGLGYELWYGRGTVIGLLGRILHHGATASGEQLCFAQYMWENVFETLNVAEPGWVRIQDLEERYSNSTFT
jgi:hypothetical protein